MKYFPLPNIKFLKACLKAVTSDDESLQAYAITVFAEAYPRAALNRELNEAFNDYYIDDFIHYLHYDNKSEEERRFACRWFYKQEIAGAELHQVMFDDLNSRWLAKLLNAVLNCCCLTRHDLKRAYAKALLDQQTAASYIAHSYFEEKQLEIMKCRVARFNAYREAIQPTEANKIRTTLKRFRDRSKKIQEYFND